MGHLARRAEGYLPTSLLFAHSLSGTGLGGAGRPRQGFTDSLESSLLACLPEEAREDNGGLKIADTDFWLHLAVCRAWWRAKVVACARPSPPV